MLNAVEKLLEATKGGSLYLSMFDVQLETIRDFGKYLSHGVKEYDFSKITPDSLEKEAAELLDNSKDPIQIRNLHKYEIKNKAQYLSLMHDQEEFRKKLDTRHKITDKRYNMMFVFTLKTRSATTHLFFIKLLTSEKMI